MLGGDVAAQLPFLRAQAESLMVESAGVRRLTAGVWSVVGSLPCRVRPGQGVVAVPPGAQVQAFASARLAFPWSSALSPGDEVQVRGRLWWVGSVSESSQMVECRVDAFRPAADVRVSVTTAPTRDQMGNPVPGVRDKYQSLAAFFAVDSSDATDLSQVSTTVVKVWLPPGSELSSSWEVRDLSTGVRFLVTGDPVVSPLGVVAQLRRGQVSNAR